MFTGSPQKRQYVSGCGAQALEKRLIGAPAGVLPTPQAFRTAYLRHFRN